MEQVGLPKLRLDLDQSRSMLRIHGTHNTLLGSRASMMSRHPLESYTYDVSNTLLCSEEDHWAGNGPEERVSVCVLS